MLSLKHDIAVNKLLKIKLLHSGSPICPVDVFTLYMSKLNHKREDLWQRPKTSISNPNSEWYDNQVIGKDLLNNAMKTLSERAQLSQMYTNHCIRASVVTKLDSEGFEARHIMVVSSHKSDKFHQVLLIKMSRKQKKKCLML